MGQAIREALAQRGFWLLNLGFLACGFQLAFIGTHLPAYLADRGLRAADGVAALAIIALANIAGTYVCGILGARYRRKHLLAYIYLIRAGAMALFFLLPLSVWSVYAFSAVMGFIWLGTVPLTNGLISQVFGVRYITTLFGFVFFGHQLGSFLGVWLGGLVYEATHSYDLIWLGAIALGCWQPCCIGPSTTANCRARAWRRHGPEGRPRRPRTGTAPGRYSGRCCVPAPIVMCSMRQGRPPWPCARRPGHDIGLVGAQDHGLDAGGPFQLQLGFAGDHAQQLVGLGVHFPLFPVRGEFIFRHQPASAVGVELVRRLRPEGIAALCRDGGAVGVEQHVVLREIGGHGMRSCAG